jgi:septal ring factor EnvC (AmiA/AmiB activator)
MKRIFCFLFFCCLAFSFLADEKELDLINHRIQEIKEKLEILKEQKGSILNEIYQIELNYEKAKIEANRIDLLLKNTRKKIKKKEMRKKELEDDIRGSRENIRKMLRIIYKLGSNSYIKLLSSINNLDELFKNYQYLVTLIDHNLNAIDSVKKKILQVEKLKNELETEYGNILKLKNSKVEKLVTMKRIKGDKLKLISTINTDKSNYLRHLDELRFQAERLNQLIYKKSSKEDLRIIDVDRLKGKLIWPVEGKIISSFGRKRSTRFNTYIFNNGIKIQPSDSDRVRAVYFGEVIYADYFMGGYGNLIIVEHAKNFHSLYGHCERFIKKPGDKVMEGECIALVGETGSIYGKSLHFEIRKDLKSQNPMSWLKKKGSGD